MYCSTCLGVSWNSCGGGPACCCGGGCWLLLLRRLLLLLRDRAAGPKRKRRDRSHGQDRQECPPQAEETQAIGS